jgi:hypothetical protein
LTRMSAPAVPSEPDSLEPLTGLIEQVTFHNAESGFAVSQVEVRGQKDLVTIPTLAANWGIALPARRGLRAVTVDLISLPSQRR